MVDAPCSRVSLSPQISKNPLKSDVTFQVGHIYRKFAPFPNPGVGDFIGRNYKRVAEVWMDEYKGSIGWLLGEISFNCNIGMYYRIYLCKKAPLS